MASSGAVALLLMYAGPSRRRAIPKKKGKDWRAQSEQFRAAMRAARGVTQAMKAGTNPADIPFVPSGECFRASQYACRPQCALPSIRPNLHRRPRPRPGAVPSLRPPLQRDRCGEAHPQVQGHQGQAGLFEERERPRRRQLRHEASTRQGQAVRPGGRERGIAGAVFVMS